MTLIQAPLAGEIIGPERRELRLIGRTHPLAGGRIDVKVRAGVTIQDILDEALRQQPGSRLAPNFLVRIDGLPIERGIWHLVRPKPGSTVTFVPVPGNLRSVLALAVTVAALIVAPYAAGFIAPALWAGLGITYATTLALVSVGIVVAGTLALNALFPIRPPSQPGPGGTFTQLPGIAGARNQAAPFGAIPVVLGQHRISPFMGAQSYTELVGDDQFLRLLFVVGYGPLTISDMKIGETPLDSFEHEIELREGYADDDPITIYPSAVHEDALAIDLPRPASAAYADIVWETRTTADGITQFSVDVTAPEGIYRVNATTGNFDAIDVRANVEYRAVGDSVWLAAETNGGVIAFTRNVKTGRKGLLQTVPRGQYEVRVGKATANDPGAEFKSKLVWSALRGFENNHPVNFAKPLTMIALRIKATDQLSGVVDTFNCIALSKFKAFDGADWVDDTGTQSPADLFRGVLQSPANARPVPDAQINLTNLEEWSAYCLGKGFKFNQVRSQAASVYDTLADIAAAGRAVPTFIDGQWGVIWDRPDDSIVDHYTPRNSWGLTGSRAYAHLPHAFRIPFINERNGYTEDERIVYDDGYSAENATLFESSIKFPGVTDPDLIWKHGRFHIAQARLRPETIALSVNWRGLIVTRGDRVRVTHDVLLIGQVAGRVKSIAGQVVTIDEAITIEEGKTYGMRFCNADTANRSILRALDPDVMTVGEYQAGEPITLVGDLTMIDGNAIFGFGETDQESAVYRVKSIARQKDLIAQITLVDDAPAISQADTGEIPGYDPHVTLPADPLTLPPQHLQYIEVIDIFGAQARSLVRFSWTYPRLGRVSRFEVQAKDVSNGGDWLVEDSVTPPLTSTEIAIPTAGLWSFRVRCLFTDGTASGWALLDSLAIDGLLAAPDDVDNFLSAYDNFNRLQLSWSIVEDLRPIKYEIRKGETWDAAQTIAEAAQSPFGTTGDGTYWIAAYVALVTGERVYSETKRSLAITDSVLVANVVLSVDEQAEGFLGSFSGAANRAGAGPTLVLTTGGGSSILDDPDFLATPDILNYGGSADGFYASPHVVNLGRVMPFRSSIFWVAAAQRISEDMLSDPDFLNNADFLSSALARLVDVYPVMRIAQSGSNDVFNPSDIFAEADVFDLGFSFGPWQRWTPDVQNALAVQFGLALEVNGDPTLLAIATEFTWTVDVQDRLDRYSNLTIAPGGTAIVFEPGGYDTTASGVTAAFIGGSNGAASLPHISVAHRNPNAGDQVKVSALTLTGCTVEVMNAGVSVGGDEVDLFAQGY